jgi:glycosyltransferase A (GT-A) superfamily protein (DUF2064 family)
MQSEDAVVVFARFPHPGKVKTRLAASIGAEQAATFYKHCAEGVMRELSRSLPGAAQPPPILPPPLVISFATGGDQRTAERRLHGPSLTVFLAK